MSTAKHPAKFSDRVMADLDRYIQPGDLLLDPFAGTGRIHELKARTIGVEIEPEWASMHPRTVVGDALCLPFAADTFTVIATSPTFGNRLADSHKAKDGSIRRSYTHDLGRPLHPNNSGALQWGEAYQEFHRAAWRESHRVLRSDGLFILNIKDHIRNGAQQFVMNWHRRFIEDELRYRTLMRKRVSASGLRFGANHGARVDVEWVLVYRKPRQTHDEPTAVHRQLATAQPYDGHGAIRPRRV